MLKKLVNTVNGFAITQHLLGSPATYYMAKRGNTVYTSKDYNYIIRKARDASPHKEVQDTDLHE